MDFSQLLRAYQLADIDIQALKTIAGRLNKHREAIALNWLERYFEYETEPWLGRPEFEEMHHDMVENMFDHLIAGRPYAYLVYLTEVGRKLARSGFPFDSLILSLHFFEEAYYPYFVYSDNCYD